jgi:hypothetical protein
MFVLSSAAMTPKTRSSDSPPHTPPDSLDPNSQHKSLAHVPDTLALVREQLPLINARLDAQTANVAAAVAAANGDPHDAQRRHDAHREPSRHELPVE